MLMPKYYSISFKIFIGMAFLTVFLLSIMWASNNFVYLKELRKYEVDYNVLVTNKIKLQFDFITELVRSAGNTLGSNAHLISLLSSKYNEGLNVYKQYHDEIDSLLTSIKDIQPFIKGVHVVSSLGDVYSTVVPADDSQIIDFSSDYFDKFSQNKKLKEYWVQLREAQYYPDTYYNVISYIYPVYNNNNKNLIGLIIIDIDHAVIRQMFAISSIEMKEKAMVVDSEGNIIFNHPFLSSYEPILKQYPQILSTQNLQFKAPVFGKDCIIVTQALDIADWKIVRMIEILPITQSSRDLLHLLYTILLISATFCFIYIHFVTQSITRHIKTLINACKRIEQGERNFRVTMNTHDELGVLGDTFNIMLDQLQDYYQKEIDGQKRKAELEFQILQAQINPHFLYNTLDSIKWLAIMQNINNIAEICTSLIYLLKYNLAHPDTITTVKDEVENLYHYIQIQKFKYGDTFEFITQLDPETYNCVILRFVLQPLVENCIIHGFEDMDSGGEIKLLSYIENNQLHIKVIDNGKGMELSHLNKLNNEINYSGKHFNTIGIPNIKERIRLQYGEEYGLYFVSEPGKGTVAEMILPVVYGSNSEKK